jgi:maltooligosyltrehalose trehalohydrolase
MIHNALYWLEEFAFDGLRLDAVHAIRDDSDPDILTELAQTVRHRITDREIHLVLENDRNQARYLARDAKRTVSFTAQWNDDLHHALHVLITGEDIGFYGDYATQPAAHLGRALAEGFAIRRKPRRFAAANPAASPRRDYRRRLWSRSCRTMIMSATSRSGPDSRHAQPSRRCMPASPSFCCRRKSRSCSWARNGRATSRFCSFAILSRVSRTLCAKGGDASFPSTPNSALRRRASASPTRPCPRPSKGPSSTGPGQPIRIMQCGWPLAIRSREIVPRLIGIEGSAGHYRVLGAKSVAVKWRMGDCSTLGLVANFGTEPVNAPEISGGAQIVYCSAEIAGAPRSATFVLKPP